MTQYPIRILQVVTIMNAGGLETMLMNYYRHIDRSQIQFDFLVHRREQGFYDDEIQKLGGKMIVMPPIRFSTLFSYCKKMRDFLHQSQYKVIHVHLDALSALPLYMAKRAGIPQRLAHSHSTNFNFDIKYPIRIFAKHWISHCATGLYACSEEAGKFMFGKASFSIMANAIDVQQYVFNKTIREKMRHNLGLQNRFVIGHVGRFRREKNHQFLLEIFHEVYKRNKEAILLLIGEGEELPIIREMAKQLGISENVQFLGVRKDIPALLQAMDVFVFPSLYEGLSVALLEAQSAGLPCVISDTVECAWKNARLVHSVRLSQPSNDWADTILEISGAQRHAIGKSTEQSGYNITENAEKLMKLYKSIYM